MGLNRYGSRAAKIVDWHVRAVIRYVLPSSASYSMQNSSVLPLKIGIHAYSV